MVVPIKTHLDLLGWRVRDCVTGIEGVVTSIGFDLYGCVQAIVNRGVDKDGKVLDSLWFDIARLSQMGEARVMEPPSYEYGSAAEGEKGPAEKPGFYKP